MNTGIFVEKEKMYFFFFIIELFFLFLVNKNSIYPILKSWEMKDCAFPPVFFVSGWLFSY